MSRNIQFWLTSVIIGVGTIFQFGEQELVKNNQQDNQTLCNMYFSKSVYTLYNGVCSKGPEAGEFSRIFVLKVTLHSVGLLLTVSYQKNGGARCTSCSPVILLGEQLKITGGATAPPAPPVSAPMHLLVRKL